MAINPATPALIDPPYWGDLQEWVRYRDELAQSGLPGLKPFLDEADDVIASLTPPAK
jgi:hypothetical protein